MNAKWTAYRVGETGFAGGFDVYAVRDGTRDIAFALTKEQANLIAAAPDLVVALHALREAEQYDDDDARLIDARTKADAVLALVRP